MDFSIKKKFMVLEMEKTVSETGYDSWSIIILDSGETNFQATWLRWKEVNSDLILKKFMVSKAKVTSIIFEN